MCGGRALRFPSHGRPDGELRPLCRNCRLSLYESWLGELRLAKIERRIAMEKKRKVWRLKREEKERKAEERRLKKVQKEGGLHGNG